MNYSNLHSNSKKRNPNERQWQEEINEIDSENENPRLKRNIASSKQMPK